MNTKLMEMDIEDSSFDDVYSKTRLIEEAFQRPEYCEIVEIFNVPVAVTSNTKPNNL